MSNRSIKLALAALALPAVVATTSPAQATGPGRPAPHFSLYVSAFGEGAIRQVPLDANGVPTVMDGGTKFKLAAPMPEATVISPDGRRLYVTDRYFPGRVEGFAIGNNGGLTALPGSPYKTGGNFPVGLAFTPDGRFLFATNYEAAVPYTGAVLELLGTTGTIRALKVAADGSLSNVRGPGGHVVSRGIEPIALAVTPDGKRLFVGHNSSSDIAEFSIGNDGQLTGYKALPTGAPGADGVVVTPDGRTLYAVTAKSQVITYDLTSGGTKLVGTPVPTGGAVPIYMALTRDGRQLWVSNLVNGTVQGFHVGQNRTLTPITSKPIATGGLGAQGIAFSPDLRTMYVSNRFSVSVAVFRLGIDGADPTPVAGSPFFTGLNSPGYAGITVTPGYSATARIGKEITARAVTFSGAESADPDGTVVKYAWNFGDDQTAVSTSPNIRHLYAASGTYRVTLEVTDNHGCSTDAGFTGASAGCADASSAATTTTVTVG